MKRRALLKTRYLKNGKIVVYFRGRKIFEHRDPYAIDAWKKGFYGEGAQ